MIMTYKTEEKHRRYEILIREILWDKQPCYTLIFNDISDKERVLSLELATKYKDRLISTISHELRTPLNGILGILDICMHMTKDVELIQQFKRCISCAK